jgi:UDP:flavonoid glycosyltransferase YjiC (YdhE family)
MIRVLCCWEIGAGFGHLFRLFPLVEEWLKNNHEVILVTKNSIRAKSIFDPIGAACYQAPANRAPAKKFPYSINYAQNLLRNGFWHKPSLQSLLSNWLELYEKFQPDIILAEHSPAALLAARLAGLNRAAIGTGFTIPPFVSPMPTMQPWFPVPQSRLIQSEEKFLNLINPVLIELGGEPLEIVAEIFAGAEPFLCTFPELDHYGSRADMHYYGPVEYSPARHEPEWPDGTDPKVFMYMRTSNRKFEAALQQLQVMPVTALACIPDMPGTELHVQQRQHLRITTEPVDLMLVAQKCSLMISQGGTNSGSLMLRSGVPVLICPKEIEQTMWALRITGQGLGSMINPFNPKPDIKAKIEAAVHSKLTSVQNKAFVQRYSNYDSKQTVSEIANRISIIGSGKQRKLPS